MGLKHNEFVRAIASIRSPIPPVFIPPHRPTRRQASNDHDADRLRPNRSPPYEFLTGII
jgi:hypothetical protein